MNSNNGERLSYSKLVALFRMGLEGLCLLRVRETLDEDFHRLSIQSFNVHRVNGLGEFVCGHVHFPLSKDDIPGPI